MQCLILFLITRVNFLTQSIEIKRENPVFLTLFKSPKTPNSFQLNVLTNQSPQIAGWHNSCSLYLLFFQ